MKTIILAGGWGTRLEGEDERIPKPMVPIGNRPIQWSPNINNSGSEIVIRIKTPGTSDTYGKISNTLDNPYFISIKEFFAAINRKGRYTYHPFILASARDPNYDYSNFYTYGESLRNQFMRERDLVRYNNGDFGIK